MTQLGARKDLGSAGILQGGLLFSGIPTQVWADPYAEGVQREETDRDSTGLRLQWDRILGTALELTFSYRDISIDTERSGEGVTSVACDAACQDLLRRDGDQYTSTRPTCSVLGEGQRHLVRPMVRYTIDDREGDAISGDGYRLQLSYVFLGQGYTVASNVAYGGTSQDARNPIFGRTDSDGFVVDTTLFYRLPIESGRWQAVGSVLWGEGNSDVAFHDNEIFMINAGVMYRLGARCSTGRRGVVTARRPDGGCRPSARKGAEMTTIDRSPRLPVLLSSGAVLAGLQVASAQRASSQPPTRPSAAWLTIPTRTRSPCPPAARRHRPRPIRRTPAAGTRRASCGATPTCTAPTPATRSRPAPASRPSRPTAFRAAKK